MQIFFTTVNRSAPVKRGGNLVRLDWESKTILGTQPIRPSNPTIVDPIPRGNTRGGRGITIVEGDLVVASYHTLHIFSQDLQHRRDVTNPLFAGLHKLLYMGNGLLWVASTAVDAALEVELATGRVSRAFWPREMPSFQSRWGLIPLAIDKTADNRGRFLSRKYQVHPSHLHLNTVAEWRGEIYGSFSNLGAIVNLSSSEVVIEDRSMCGSHNLSIEPDGTAFVNDTRNRAVRIYDLTSRTLLQTIVLTEFEPIRRIEQRFWLRDLIMRSLKRVGIRTPVARPIFVRGFERVGDRLFVGFSPATIACIDLPSGKLVDLFEYSRDVSVCIHGIKAVPAAVVTGR